MAASGKLAGRFSTLPKMADGGEVENLPCSRKRKLAGRFSTLPKNVRIGLQIYRIVTADYFFDVGTTGSASAFGYAIPLL